MAARISDAINTNEHVAKLEPTEQRGSIQAEEAQVKGESDEDQTPEVKEELSERNTSIESADRIKDEEATVKMESPDEEQPNYLILIAMVSSDDPMITRFLSVPPYFTFADFHNVLQVAFGWSSIYMHQFFVDVLTRHSDGEHAQDLYPKTVLQLEAQPVSMDMWPEPQDEASWRLRDVFEKKVWEGEDGRPVGIGPGEGEVGLRYDYDMGDRWTHHITVLGRAEPMLHKALGSDGAPVVCLGGQGHPCAEKCGGSVGWQNLKDAFKKQRGNRNTKELKDWYKNDCYNGDPEGLDPYQWDDRVVNDELLKLCEPVG